MKTWATYLIAVVTAAVLINLPLAAALACSGRIDSP